MFDVVKRWRLQKHVNRISTSRHPSGSMEKVGENLEDAGRIAEQDGQVVAGEGIIYYSCLPLIGKHKSLAGYPSKPEAMRRIPKQSAPLPFAVYLDSWFLTSDQSKSLTPNLFKL